MTLLPEETRKRGLGVEPRPRRERAVTLICISDVANSYTATLTELPSFQQTIPPQQTFVEVTRPAVHSQVSKLISPLQTLLYQVKTGRILDLN